MKYINNIKKLKNNRLNNRGYSLTELIAVVTILAIIMLIFIPIYSSYIERAKEVACNANCSQLERMYDIYLLLENVDHLDIVFEQYLQEYGKNVCPENGEITYIDGKVQCSIHCKKDTDKSNDNEGEGVPFL